MKEYKIKSFEFASDLTKQLITLATILIGLSLTFYEKFEIEEIKYLIVWSWISFLVSIIIGIATLMSLTGTLSQIVDASSENATTIYQKNIRITSSAQILTFLLGMGLLISFGSQSKTDTKVAEKDEIMIIKESKYRLLESEKRDTFRGAEN